MPKIESFHDPSLSLTVISVYGDVKPAEMPKCIDHYYRGNRSNLVLFDFSDARVSARELPEVRFNTRDRERWSRKGDRKAFVFSDETAKNHLQSALEEYCRIEETGSNLDVFHSLIDANRWLLQAREAHR